jgi:hypothetical protein
MTLLRLSMATLLVVDLVGGLLAVASGVNTWGEAWGGEALLAAPVPMIAAQVLLTWLATRSDRRSAVVAAALLAVACLVSVVSGFFDGGLGNDELTPALTAFQVLLLVVTGVTGLLAAARAAEVHRRRGRARDARLG